jgi:hypothetical protein
MNVTAILMGDPAARQARRPTAEEMMRSYHEPRHDARGEIVAKRRKRHSIIPSMPWLQTLQVGQRVTGLTERQVRSAYQWLYLRGMRCRVTQVRGEGALVFTLERVA